LARFSRRLVASADGRFEMGAVLAGLALVAGLAWLTHWTYAVLAAGFLLVAYTSSEPLSAPVPEVPLWMSRSSGRLFLSASALLGLVVPIVAGIVWFRWWWGFAGSLVGLPSASFLSTALPNHVLRIALGFLIAGLGIALLLAGR
jgi:hypothetical protein